MKKVHLEDLDALAVGATFLGSGGGGDPKPDLVRTKEIFMQHGPAVLIDCEELQPDDLIVPIGFMGAPLVSIEKLPSGKECLAVLDMITKYYGKAPRALVALEIGGSNAFVPLALGALTKLPVLDADTLGRAFPELHMSSCALHGIPCSPAFLASSFENRAQVEASSPKMVEKIARSITETLGSSVAVSLYILRGAQAKEALVQHTVTQAMDLGKEILAGSVRGKRLASGTITDVEQDIQGGFLHGTVRIKGLSEAYEIDFQNEYLVVKDSRQVLASTPDIIAILEKETLLPLPVERLKYGLHCEIVAERAPLVWQSEKALQIVGPKAFGYDFDYRGVHA